MEAAECLDAQIKILILSSNEFVFDAHSTCVDIYDYNIAFIHILYFPVQFLRTGTLLQGLCLHISTRADGQQQGKVAMMRMMRMSVMVKLALAE